MRTAARFIAIAVVAAISAGGVRLYAATTTTSSGGVKVASPLEPASPPDAPSPAQQQPDPVAPTPTEPAPHEPAAPQADPRSAGGRLIEVSIRDQQLIAWHDGVEIYRFTISTGRRGYETPTGRFRVHTKYEKRWSRKWKVWMPYALFWHPRYGYAFHELPHRNGSTKRIGASRLGRADSHGCVRVNVGDAKKLYDWAPVGTAVWIH